MNRLCGSIIVLLLMLAATLPARGESLWERRVPQRAFLFYDTQARYLGDLLTVVINENTDVQNRENRSQSKESESGRAYQLEAATGGDFGASARDASLQFDGSANRSFDGSATFRSEQEFSTRVTVSVVDVLPNGNLVVAGQRQVFVAGDRRLLSLSGVVRPEDVSADNSVQSRFVSNLIMTYDAEGPEQRHTRRGWLGRLMNRLWPD